MTKTELYKKLCSYDPRSPEFDPEFPEAKIPVIVIIAFTV